MSFKRLTDNLLSGSPEHHPRPRWGHSEVIPGSPERQNFRRKVVSRAGMAWLRAPVSIREYILDQHIGRGDVEGAEKGLRQFTGITEGPVGERRFAGLTLRRTGLDKAEDPGN